MIGDEWYEAPTYGVLKGAVGHRPGRSYFEFYAESARRQLVSTSVAAVNLQPGNATAYRLIVASVTGQAGIEMMASIGCRRPLAVVWADTCHGHVFPGDDLGILHETYVSEKMGCSLSDAWVIGRFLTALRSPDGES